MQQLDQFNFHTTVEQSTGTAVVLFSAPGCSGCRRLHQALVEFEGSISGPTLYEVDVSQDLALAREFEIYHLPALFLYLDGDFHAALQCKPEPDSIQQAIQSAQHLPAQEAP